MPPAGPNNTHHAGAGPKAGGVVVLYCGVGLSTVIVAICNACARASLAMASLLLRLFHSDYFSPHLALSYLKTYSDNIGITYYLVYRLRTSFPPEQVEFYWPQLW